MNKRDYYEVLGVDKKSYINSLYGRILYVLQINDNDLEFKKYKQYILDLKKTI